MMTYFRKISKFRKNAVSYIVRISLFLEALKGISDCCFPFSTNLRFFYRITLYTGSLFGSPE